MSELEKEVLEIINCEIEGCYIGNLKVKEDRIYQNITCNRCDPTSELYSLQYSLLLYLNTYYEPTVMSYEFRQRRFDRFSGWENEEEYKKLAQEAFKEFITEEFKNRMLQQVDYFRLILQLPSLDCNEQS